MQSPSEISAFDRGIRPMMTIVLPEKAKEIVEFRADPELQIRVEELASKSTEGKLTDAERAEYAGYARANKYIAILKRQARAIGSRPRLMTRLEGVIDDMLDGSIMLDEALEVFEKLYIKKASTRKKNRISHTAAALGIHKNKISKRVNSSRAETASRRPRKADKTKRHSS